jgi:hypothetical protein
VAGDELVDAGAEGVELGGGLGGERHLQVPPSAVRCAASRERYPGDVVKQTRLSCAIRTSAPVIC